MADKEKARITIVGLGLIGGSLGMALKAAGLAGFEIVGHDRDSSVERAAQKKGAIDRGEHNLPRAVAGASVVILATPITAMREVFQQIAPDVSEGAVVTDTASTKATVMQWAGEVLPGHASFVGGHPMAGKEHHGIDNAEADLFQGKAYCIIPSLNATPSAIQRVTGLARAVGAEPMYMEADEHDQYAAAVSHLPLMVSAAMFTLLRSSPSWDDLRSMAAGGFRDMTRLTSGDPGMSHGIWRTNREAIIHWLERMMGELGRFRDMLQDAQDEQLLETFIQAQLQRDQFLNEPIARMPAAGVDPADAKSTALSLLVGGMMADNLKRAGKIPELMEQQAAERSAKEGRKMSYADRVAEGIRRDLEKLEQKDAEKAKDEPFSGENAE